MCFADEPAAFAEACLALLRDRVTGGRRWAAERALSSRRITAGMPSCRGWRRCTRDATARPVRRRQHIRLTLLSCRPAPPYQQIIPGSVAPRSVLLIRPDHLGDMLFLTPAFRLAPGAPASPDHAAGRTVGPRRVRRNPDLDAIEICVFPGFERQPKESGLAPYRLLLATARELAGADSMPQCSSLRSLVGRLVGRRGRHPAAHRLRLAGDAAISDRNAAVPV